MRKACAAVLAILCFAAVAIAAIAVVQHKAVAGGGSVAQTTPGVNTSGSDLFVECVAAGSSPVLDDGQNAQGTYTALTQRGSGPYLTCQWKKSPTTNASTQWASSDSGNFPAVAAIAFSGTVTASSPFDAQSGATGTGTSTSALSISTSASNNVAILACAFDVAVSGITVSGYTNADTVTLGSFVNWGITLWYKIGVSATENPTISWTGSAGYACELADFKNPLPPNVARRTPKNPRNGSRQVQ